MWNLSNVETRRAGNASYQGPSLAVVVRAFWAILKGLRSQKTTEESQPPVRAKVGATWVPGRKSESIIMKAELVEAASKVITSPQILVNMVSRRVRQLDARSSSSRGMCSGTP